MTTQKAAIFPLDISALIESGKFADRFSYSSYFVPVQLVFKDDKDTPVLTFTQKRFVARFATKHGSGNILEWLSDAGYPRLLARNGVPSEIPGPAPINLATPTIPDASPEEGKDVLLGLIQSEIGYLFLDRTRIRPAGFALGEHIYSISLSPAEEVTIEQKSFSKRTVTLEQANETEQSLDLELASTLTSELDESMDRTKSLTDKWGLSASHTGSYKSPEFFWGSFNASHTINYAKDVSEASTETARRSLKDTRTSSSKISAKYRSSHKTVFSVKTEVGFESNLRRIIRNSNRFTPVDYHFFKVLRVVDLSHERYGALLCWAPYVKAPASQFFARVKTGKEAILNAAEAARPPEPQAPQKPKADGGAAVTQRGLSSQIEADKWGFFGDMSADYELGIPIPSGWRWSSTLNGAANPVDVKLSVVNVSKGYHAEPVGDPWMADGQLKVRVHVGCATSAERGDFFKSSHIYMQVGATLDQAQSDNPVDTAALAAAFADYLTRHKDWEDKVAKIRQDAMDAAAKWEASMLESSNPINELMSRLITEHFPLDVRDEGSEIEWWQRIFQWDAASFVLYPGSWSDSPLRDPLADPNHFFNASWARLLLPVREGMEEAALTWIMSKTSRSALDAGLTGGIKDLVSDLEAYRSKNLASEVVPGTPPVKCPDIVQHCQCLGHWQECLPTDGTHIEVTQSASLSMESFAQHDIEDVQKIREADLNSRRQDVALKAKAIDIMKNPAQVHIHLGTDNRSDDPKE